MEAASSDVREEELDGEEGGAWIPPARFRSGASRVSMAVLDANPPPAALQSGCHKCHFRCENQYGTKENTPGVKSIYGNLLPCFSIVAGLVVAKFATTEVHLWAELMDSLLSAVGAKHVTQCWTFYDADGTSSRPRGIVQFRSAASNVGPHWAQRASSLKGLPHIPTLHEHRHSRSSKKKATFVVMTRGCCCPQKWREIFASVWRSLW